MLKKTRDLPEKVKAFVELGFNYHVSRVTGRQCFGDCIFCGKSEHFYINIDTGQWECKRCAEKGNISSFIQKLYAEWLEEVDSKTFRTAWVTLSRNRGIPIDILKEAGIVYDGQRFVLPIRNQQGIIVNLRLYEIGGKFMGLPGLPNHIYGIEYFAGAKKTERVFGCEGEWDAIALRWLLKRENKHGIVIGAPGGTFKSAWNDFFRGRETFLCYDADTAGAKFLKNTFNYIKHTASVVKFIDWPLGTEDGYDVKDLIVKEGIDYAKLDEMFAVYVPEEEREEDKAKAASVRHKSIHDRPTFEETVRVYQKYLKMTPEMIDGLRIVYAVILSLRIRGGVPLWMHIVGPPGSGKTALLETATTAYVTYPISTLTPHALISGFKTSSGEDASLLPKLNDRVLILKDFTEILGMPKIHQDEIFGTLRGIYDGYASKPFGTGNVKEYSDIWFNTLTGVTPAIYGARHANMGERFLMYHLVKGNGINSDDIIRQTIRNVKRSVQLKSDLTDAAAEFLDVEFGEEDVPEIEVWAEDKIIALSQLVSWLRANVEREYKSDNLIYKPQAEIGTRIAGQLSKLLMGLGLVNNPPEIGDREYDIVTRVALDSCVGFNLDAVASMIDTPGQNIEELAEDCKIPKSTLRDQIEDLAELGAVYKKRVDNPNGRGGPITTYHVGKRLRELWENAGLIRDDGVVRSFQRERQAGGFKTIRVKKRSRK